MFLRLWMITELAQMKIFALKVLQPHTNLEALAVEKKSTSNETISTFKLTHWWTKIH